MTVLSRKLCAVLAASALSGSVLAAPVIAPPPAQAAEAPAAQASPEVLEEQLFTYSGFYIMQGDTDSFDLLREDLPVGTTLTLAEGEALESLRAEGWSVSVADNVLTVTAPRRAEGRYEIPVLVTLPDQTVHAASLDVLVDYLVDIPLSVWIPVLAYFQLAQSSTSSAML